MGKYDFAETFRKRTKNLAIEIIKLYQTLPKTEESKIVGRQIIRSATSVAANYRAACRGISQKELHANLSITIEEADETLLWIEIVEKSEISKSEI